MQPQRIQRKCTRGWKMPENTVYVGRPTKWGNPFEIGMLLADCPAVIVMKSPYRDDPIDTILTRQMCIDLYRVKIQRQMRKCKTVYNDLAGHNLACWCRLDQPCHADVLLELANQCGV